MSRIINFAIMLAALFGIMVVQTSGALIMDELRNEFNEDADASFNQQEINDDMFTSVVKWVPTIALFGVFLMAAWIEYQRTRITATRSRRV